MDGSGDWYSWDFFFLYRDGSMQLVAERCFFVDREEDDEKERADSSKTKQQQRANTSG